jgi:four helix bundle protein
MPLFRTFEEIEVWQRGRELVKQVYGASRTGEFFRDFGLRDQIRRAGVSIMANIAEGFERGSRKQFLQYLVIAKASAAEVRCHLYVALDQGYINTEQAASLFDRVTEVSKMIAGLMRHLHSLPPTSKSR